MAELLLDAGSSALKALWVEQAVAGTPEVFVYGQAGPIPEQWLRRAAHPARILGICVAGDQRRRAIERQCQARWGMRVQWLRTRRSAAGITNGYREPGELGVDRWAAMAGARGQTPDGFCVVDLGTATTLDAVTADGSHLGGWILPGLDLAAEAMRSRWPRLYSDAVEAMPVVNWPAGTAEALASGYPQAQAGTLERFQRLARERSGEAMAVIVTGAGAATVAELLSIPARLDPLLVFRGMCRLVRDR